MDTDYTANDADICITRDGAQIKDIHAAHDYAHLAPADRACLYPSSLEYSSQPKVRCASFLVCNPSLRMIGLVLLGSLCVVAGVYLLFKRMRRVRDNETEVETDDAEELLSEEKRRGRKRGRRALLEPIMESLGTGLRVDRGSRSRARSARAKRDDDEAGVH